MSIQCNKNGILKLTTFWIIVNSMAVKPKSLLVRVYRGHNRTVSDQGDLQCVRIVFLYFRKPTDVSEGAVI